MDQKEIVFEVTYDQFEHIWAVCQEAAKDPTGELAFKAMVEYQDIMVAILGLDPEQFDSDDMRSEEAKESLRLMIALQEQVRALSQQMQPWVSKLETQPFVEQGPHALVAWYRGHLARLDELEQMEPSSERMNEFRTVVLDFNSANNFIAGKPSKFKQQLNSLDWLRTVVAIDAKIKALTPTLLSDKDLTPPSSFN